MANTATKVVRETGNRVPTGISGLDEILGGGFPEHRIYLVEGTPGPGKSSFATQYIWQSAKRKERVACYLFEEGRKSFHHPRV